MGYGLWSGTAYNPGSFRRTQDDRVYFHTEPEAEQLDAFLRRLTSNRHSSARQWADAYLAAFATTAGLTLVTFDRGLRHMAGVHAVLLE